MAAPELRVEDYQGIDRWRWKLVDSDGRFLGDHEVSLEPQAAEYQGYLDLPRYLRNRRDPHENSHAEDEKHLREMGAWLGKHLFGSLGGRILARLRQPVTVVRVIVPEEAQDLLFRPFELAHPGDDGKTLVDHRVRFVYQRPDPPESKKTTGRVLRLLAVFSLPTNANPLNLRRERYELARLIDDARARGYGVDLRVLQYGATRKTLGDELEQAPGWDIIHFSGHGGRGMLLLEDEHGRSDEIGAAEIEPLLLPTKDRLKLLILSACWSGAASHRAAREMLGLDGDPTLREAVAEQDEEAEVRETAVASLGQDLARSLDCAVLAMRYPVGDQMAADLMLSLYGQVLDNGQPLAAALQLALAETTSGDRARLVPPLSSVTPIVFGRRAAELKLPLEYAPDEITIEPTGLFGFPLEPERFVGRLMPMLRASRTFSRESERRGVLFHGMAGGGKTACALELVYRQERRRFAGYVFYKAPSEGDDIAGAMTDFLHAMESQLNMPGGGLMALADPPERLKARLVPRLRALLERSALLIVLDNMESLLSSSGGWRDDMWGELIEAMLGHRGPSRLVLTSRRLPASLEGHSALLVEPIHALSFAESVVLARDMEHLGGYFADAAGRALLRRALGVVQGHPQLLLQADELAADRERFAEQVSRTESEGEGVEAKVRAFFDKGESEQSAEDYVATLYDWTTSLAGQVPETARLLFSFLCGLEDEDRTLSVIEPVWPNFLRRVKEEVHEAAAALEEPGDGLAVSLEKLVACGLVAKHRHPSEEDDTEQIVYEIHPGVAEAGRGEAPRALLGAVDEELQDFWGSAFTHGLETEPQGWGPLIVTGARRAVPYFLRAEHWDPAATLLERLIKRDSSPATLSWAIPRLRRIASATKGTDNEAGNLGVLAVALLESNHTEAEALLRGAIAASEARGDFRTASASCQTLADLLRALGRSKEALTTAKAMKKFTRRAGLGPWTQASDEVSHLQILNDMGHYKEALEAVEALLKRLESLPKESKEEEEAIAPGSVREATLDTGRQAALGLEQWETALRFNEENVDLKRRRGAGDLEIATALFNDHGPLIELGRLVEARELLEACRDIDDEARDYVALGKDYGALGALEAAEGHPDLAVSMVEIALRYHYRAGEPEACEISHNNLSNYLERAGQPRQAWLAHRLASALLCAQMESGTLATSIGNLASSDPPAAPPAFDDVADEVERIEGVRFRDLFAHLPRRYADGDLALAAIWKLVDEERARREQMEATLATLPEDLRQLFELEGEDFNRALGEALDQRPPEEREEILRRLQDAGLIGSGFGPDAKLRLSNEFDPILAAIAAVACGEGNEQARAEARIQIEEDLAEIQERGYHIAGAVHRIWDEGERDPRALTADLDEQDTFLVERILEFIEHPPKLGPDMEKVLDEAEPLLLAVAAIASGAVPEPEQAERRATIMQSLQGLEEQGWMIADASRRIMDGERDATTLTAEVDPNSALLIHHILKHVGTDPTMDGKDSPAGGRT